MSPPVRASELGPEDPVLMRHLDDLWTEYMPEGEKWRSAQARRQMEQRPGRREVAAQRKLWKSLVPFHSRVPPMALFYVDYPEHVLRVVPPASMLLGDAGRDVPWEIYAGNLAAGANRLAQR
jgi:hypothetical protein